MLTIKKAEINDAEWIYELTKKAFEIYQKALGEDAEFVSPALLETADDVKYDIINHNVYAAFLDGKPAGSIRFKSLSISWLIFIGSGLTLKSITTAWAAG